MRDTSGPDVSRRRHWPMRVAPLGQEPPETLAQRSTAGERLAMVWEITEQSWLFSGRELPEYSRDQMPGRVHRPAQ